MKIEALLFDMDGTIIKSLSIWDEIIASFVGIENIETFKNLRNRSSGKGLARDCNILRSVFDVAKNDSEIEHLYYTRSKDFFSRTSIDFVEGFIDFHKHLMMHNMKISLVTNAPNYGLNVLKSKLNLPSFFGHHIYNSCMMDYKFKPDPTILLHALDKLKVSNQNCVIFEDSFEGITAAKRANIRCIAINNGTNSNEISHADFVIDNYVDLTVEKIISLFS
jgi:beta-phosphoglucomutase